MDSYPASALDLPRRSAPPRLLIADQRFAASRAFGESARVLGHQVVLTGGDVTDLWTRHLRALWHEGDGEISGMTGHDVLFCLERFAWDFRHCVSAWVDHVPRDGGGFDHVARTANCESLTARLAVTSSDFPRMQADVLGSGALGSARGLPSHATSGARNHEPLASWVIAPRSSPSQGVMA